MFNPQGPSDCSRTAFYAVINDRLLAFSPGVQEILPQALGYRSWTHHVQPSSQRQVGSWPLSLCHELLLCWTREPWGYGVKCDWQNTRLGGQSHHEFDIYCKKEGLWMTAAGSGSQSETESYLRCRTTYVGRPIRIAEDPACSYPSRRPYFADLLAIIDLQCAFRRK